MNEHVISELERLVEQSVRPVRTEFKCKKRMREDLFTHLSETYQEEFTRVHDQTAALRRTRERFGDPAEVSRELRESVTLSQCFGYWFEQALGLQAHESFLHQLVKHQLVSFVVFVEMSIFCLLFGLDRGDPRVMLWIFATVMIVAGLTGSVMQWLTDRMGRAMQNPDPHRSRQLKWRSGLLSLTIFPLFLLLNYLGMSLSPDVESFTLSSAFWIAALALAPIGPLVTNLMGPMSAERTLYQEKWAELELPAE